MYGRRTPEGEGGVAVGRVARMASRVAVVTGGGAVGGTGSGEWRRATVGEARGEDVRVAGLVGEATSDEGEMNSCSRAVRRTSSTTNSPMDSPRMMRTLTRRVILPQLLVGTM
jgi:hypothetical protein